MSSFSTEEFRQGFLEEANQHLLSITNNLLRLEVLESRKPAGDLHRAPGSAAAVERIELLEELIRSFHTIKGLSGMVGLSEAARLSHAMESVLQSVQKGEVTATPEEMDTLLQGTRTLASVVETISKPQSPIPDVEPSIQKIHKLLHPSAPEPESSTPEGPGEPIDLTGADAQSLLPGLASYPAMLSAVGELEESKILSAVRSGQSFSLIIFTSTADRASRGENVDLVRQQILEIGMLIKAVPVMGSGEFQFHFLVASPQPVDPASLLADEVIPLVVQTITAAQEERLPTSRQAPADLSSSPVVRVNLERLDDLMRTAGDLLMQRGRLGDLLARLEGLPEAQRRDLNTIFQQMGRTLRDLRRGILHARMVPLAESFNRMPLVVRDLARASQKDVRLEISGENIEVDKLLVERLLDPLLHLVRNAVSHGIESPQERASAGKPKQGLLRLRGILQGDHIIIEISDDGRGLNLSEIADKAERLGWRSNADLLEPYEVLDLITRPGFSTRGEVDMASGRGMGLDIVQRMVKTCGGQLSLETAAGKGTTFRMRLPLTLVIMDVIFIRCGGERFAVPRGAVERVLEIDPAAVVRTESNMLLHQQDGYFILHDLADLLHTRRNGDAPKVKYGLQAWQEVETAGANGSGVPVLLVDRVIEIREVVVHTVTDPLLALPGIDGATELSDGNVVLILDVPALLRLAKKG